MLIFPLAASATSTELSRSSDTDRETAAPTARVLPTEDVVFGLGSYYGDGIQPDVDLRMPDCPGQHRRDHH